MKPTIFLGGTTEGDKYLQIIEEKIRPFAKCVKWNKGVFEVSGNTQKSLVDALRQSDFAVFVITADAIVDDRGKILFTPRDNLIFEAGMAFGAVAPERTFLVPERIADLKIPTDLAGFTLTRGFLLSDPEAGLSAAVDQIKESVKRLGNRALRKQVDKTFLRSQSLQLIKSATHTLIMIGRDLSWVQDYVDEIKKAIARNVRVDVICETPQHDDWKRNVRHLEDIGASVFHTKSDTGLRLTFIDHINENTAQFIFSSKERQGDKLLYQYEMHDGRSSRVLWQTLSRLHEAICAPTA